MEIFADDLLFGIFEEEGGKEVCLMVLVLLGSSLCLCLCLCVMVVENSRSPGRRIERRCKSSFAAYIHAVALVEPLVVLGLAAP